MYFDPIKHYLLIMRCYLIGFSCHEFAVFTLIYVAFVVHSNVLGPAPPVSKHHLTMVTSTSKGDQNFHSYISLDFRTQSIPQVSLSVKATL